MKSCIQDTPLFVYEGSIPKYSIDDINTSISNKDRYRLTQRNAKIWLASFIALLIGCIAFIAFAFMKGNNGTVIAALIVCVFVLYLLWALISLLAWITLHKRYKPILAYVLSTNGIDVLYLVQLNGVYYQMQTVVAFDYANKGEYAELYVTDDGTILEALSWSGITYVDTNNVIDKDSKLSWKMERSAFE